MKADRLAPLLSLGLAALALGGCDSSNRYEHAKVRGKVTYHGKPMTFGSVLFVPVVPPVDGSMQPASGSITPEGTYELKSQSAGGAILGEHKVVVLAFLAGSPAKPDEPPKEGPAPASPTASKESRVKSSIPAKYSDPKTTPLTRKVVAGENVIDIEIED